MHFELISDLHKDARGFRPSSDWMTRFRASSFAEQEAEWNALCAELDRAMEEEERAQQQAITRFEARVSDLIASGAGDRATAIRWIVDAEGCADDLPFYGMESLCYTLGLPYRYFDQKEAA